MDKTKKHKFKKENLYKIIWITCLYVILIIILWLVIEYKVKWESADLNRYVRFYNCSGSLCTTEENITIKTNIATFIIFLILLFHRTSAGEE